MTGVNNEPIQLIDAMLLWAIAVRVRAEPFQRLEQLGRPGPSVLSLKSDDKIGPHWPESRRRSWSTRRASAVHSCG